MVRSGGNSNLSEILCILVTCKYKQDRIKNNRDKVETLFFPIISQWGLSVAMETRALIQSPQNLMQPFPHPSDATHKMWSRLAYWLQRYSSLKWWMTTTTDHWYTIMYQSFVTTAPPHLWGIAGTTTFHPNSPAKSPVLRGPAASHSPALYKSKFLGLYYHKPGTYPVLLGNSKGHCPAH